MNKLEERVFAACAWNQANDSNGEFLELWAEYIREELTIVLLIDIVNNATMQAYEDLYTSGNIADANEVKKYIVEV